MTIKNLKAMKKILLLLLTVVTALAYSQAPEGFSYQAVVRDSDGQPLSDQPVGVRLTLEDATGATAYYVESHAVTSSPQGVITLSVGTGEVLSGTLETVPWSDGGIHIRVEVDPAGGNSYVLLGSTELKSVP